MKNTSIYSASNYAPVVRNRTPAAALRAFARSDAFSLAERPAP
jgi:hypothetical protein